MKTTIITKSSQSMPQLEGTSYNRVITDSIQQEA